ncbi:hypothetical protein [Cohnella mopanensis]|uniref:hypothetical protein n=1 Tax=Cohnella mopanensis TaxID=2911966 RepID=UPI001EF9015D|nr:hypothetical protein [Cohnella mopanensis]
MDKKRDFARIVTLIYVLAIFLTLAVIFLIGLPFSRTSHTWISLGGLILAETAIYGLALHYSSNGKRSLIPGYLAYSVIAGLYLIAVIVFIIVFSLALDISTFSYGLLHFIGLALAAIMASLVTLYTRHAEQQDDEVSSSSIQWVPDARHTLLSIKQELEGWDDEAGSGLSKGIKELDEKIRYSDPTSHPTLTGEEEDILNGIQLLAGKVSKLVQAEVMDGEAERLGREIRDISNGVTNRNQRLIQLKG